MQSTLRGAILAAFIVRAPLAYSDPPDPVAEAIAELAVETDTARGDAVSFFDRVEVELSVGAWLPRLNGRTALRGRAISLQTAFDLGGAETELNIELTLRIDDRWQVRVNWFDFSHEEDDVFGSFATFGGLALTPGTAYESSVDVEWYGIDVGVDVFEPSPKPMVGPRPRPDPPPPSGDAHLRHTIFGGIRYLDVEQRVNLRSGAHATGDGNWVALGAGAQVDFNWSPAGDQLIGDGIGLRASVFIGSDVLNGGGLLIEVRASVLYQVTPNAGVTFGYRYFNSNVDDDHFTFDGGLRGLFLGGVIRF